MFLSIVSASVNAGNVVAPYPIRHENNQKLEHFGLIDRGTRTKPLSRGDTKVAVPLTVLDALLGNEPSLKPDELLVRTLHALRSLYELPDRVRAEVQQPLDPAHDGLEAIVGGFGELVEELLEVLRFQKRFPGL